MDLQLATSDQLVAAEDDLAEARRQLEAAWLTGPDQDRTRAEILAFCEANPDALWRTCRPGHLTGSALVVDPSAGETLLIHHAKLHRWLQPGGHADGDGNLGRVALREATEETGLTGLRLVTPAIDVDIHEIPARGDDPDHLHLDLRFAVIVGTERNPIANDEVLGARWLAVDDPAVQEGELRRAVARALEVARLAVG